MDDFKFLYCNYALHLIDPDLARFFQMNIEALHDLYKNMFIIDIGCGTGDNVQFLNTHFKDAINVNALGIDINESAIANSKGNCKNIDLFKMGNNICDIVTDIECLAYLGEPGIKKASNMLKPNGTIFSKMFLEEPVGIKWVEEIIPYNQQIINKYFRKTQILHTLERKHFPSLSVKEIIWIGSK